jgi:hypothetical protein
MNSHYFLLYLFPDDVVFRRIKYATNPGRFESMTKRAIWLFLGEEDAQVDLALYKVTFFYTDPHGDKVSIESDSDIFSAANQFTTGGLKVFANVQSRQDKAEEKNPADLKDLIAEGIRSYMEDAKKAAEMKMKQMKQMQECHRAEFVRNYVERAKKAEEKKQAERIAEAAIVRCLEDAKKAEEQKQTDAVAQTLHNVVQSEEKAAQSDACEESKTTDETACEEEQAGSSDEEESDDETADSTPPLAARRELQTLFSKASPVKTSVPKEVDIVSKEGAEPSFASDAEGSGEIAAVLGETLDRFAGDIDDFYLDLNHTPSAEETKKDIVVEGTKEVNHESWREELDGKDDCSHDSWNVVSDHSDNSESRD